MTKRRCGAFLLLTGLLLGPTGALWAQHHGGPSVPQRPNLPVDRMTRPDDSVRKVLRPRDATRLRRPNPAGAVGARLEAIDLELAPHGEADGNGPVRRLMPRLLRRAAAAPVLAYETLVDDTLSRDDKDLSRRFGDYVARTLKPQNGKTRLTKVRLQKIRGEYWARWEYDDYSATFEDGRPCYHWSWLMKVDAGALDPAPADPPATLPVDADPESKPNPEPPAGQVDEKASPASPTKAPESGDAPRPSLPPSLDPRQRGRVIADLAGADEPAVPVETTKLDLGPGPFEVLPLPGDPPPPPPPENPRLVVLPGLDAGGDREVMLLDARPVVIERPPPAPTPTPSDDTAPYAATGNPNQPAMPQPIHVLGRPGSVAPGQTPLSPGEKFAREQRKLLEEGARQTRGLLLRGYEVGVDTTKTALTLTAEAYTPVAMVVSSTRDTEETTRRALEAGDGGGTAFLKGVTVGTVSLGEAVVAGTVSGGVKGLKWLERSKLTCWITRGGELGAADYLVAVTQGASENLSVKEPLKAFLLDDDKTLRRSFLGRGLDSLRFVSPGAAFDSRRAPMPGALRFDLMTPEDRR